MAVGRSGVVYVFLALHHQEDRRYRIAELGTRCYIARGMNWDASTVVGIATERYERGRGFSVDLFYYWKPDWSEEDQAKMLGTQKDLGHFANPRQTSRHEDQYPT